MNKAIYEKPITISVPISPEWLHPNTIGNYNKNNHFKIMEIGEVPKSYYCHFKVTSDICL